MRRYLFLFLVLSVLSGQTVPHADEPEPYVRRFSAGGIVSVTILSLMSTGTMDQHLTNPALRINGVSEDQSARTGIGLALQLSLRGRYALAGNVLYRRAGYKLITQTWEPGNIEDTENLAYTTQEATKASYWDVPILVRRYNIGHRNKGWRYFYEAGPSMRHASNIRTSIQLEPTGGESVCCVESAAQPSSRTLFGATIGAGVQFIDDFGLRIVPEVRYTRWFGTTFNSLSAQSRRDQVEINFSLTF